MPANERRAAEPRPLARLASASLLVVGAVTAGACSESPAGPAAGEPNTDPPVRQLRSFTEWVRSEPELKQQTEFFYDGEDRLVRDEFGALDAEGSRRTTVRTLYERQGDLLVGLALEIRPPGGEWIRTVEAEFFHDDSGRIERAEIDRWNERTGATDHSTRLLEYTEEGRLARVDKGGGNVEEYTYDDDGDVVRFDSRGENHLVHRYEHDGTLNPFRTLPVISGVNILGVPDRRSVHNSVSQETRVQGASAPASRAVGEVFADQSGHPTRKEWTVWNTATPDVRTEIVTIYEYR